MRFSRRKSLSNLRLRSAQSAEGAYRFKESSTQRLQIWVLFQNALIFYCTLYVHSPNGISDAVVRHANLVQITC